MSHIITNEEELNNFNYFLKDIKLDKSGISTFRNIVELALPKSNDTLLIDYKILNNKLSSTAEFVPNYETIYFNYEKLLKWTNINYELYKEKDNINNDILKKYLIMFCILHEVEHSYQYLMGKNIITPPCNVVGEVYDKLMDLLVKKDYVIPRPITNCIRYIRIFKYKANENIYVLERNANIEAGTAMIELCRLNNDLDILKVFNEIVRVYTLDGYIEDNKGCMYHTCKKLLYKNFYNSVYKDDLSFEDRIRYGLKISDEERQNILSKFKK